MVKTTAIIYFAHDSGVDWAQLGSSHLSLQTAAGAGFFSETSSFHKRLPEMERVMAGAGTSGPPWTALSPYGLPVWQPQRSQLLIWQLKAPGMSVPRETGRSSILTSEIIQCHFYHTLFLEKPPRPAKFQGEGTESTSLWKKCQGICRLILELPY